MSERKTSTVHWIAGGVLLTMMYVGTYYATVRPFESLSRTLPYYTDGNSPQFHLAMDSFLTYLFASIHKLDRHVRPHLWGRATNHD
jgi:hypothetical protein